MPKGVDLRRYDRAVRPGRARRRRALERCGGVCAAVATMAVVMAARCPYAAPIAFGVRQMSRARPDWLYEPDIIG